MADRARRVVLFVGAAERAQAAEAAFNAVAGRLGLPWAGTSRTPGGLTAADLEAAARVVAVDRAHVEPPFASGSRTGSSRSSSGRSRPTRRRSSGR